MRPHMIYYNQQMQEIKQGLMAKASRAKQEAKLRQYCLVTANFRLLLPEVLEQYGYEESFIELLWKRCMAYLDETVPERVQDLEYRGDFQDIVTDTKTPRIFAAFHMGSYRAIIGALAQLGYDFTLVVNDTVYQSQKDSTEETVRRINKLYGTSSNIDILNAEQYDTAMKMVKHLKKGRSIIAYADGNTGTGGALRQDGKLLKINFFDHPIFARQGITYTSFLANVPVVPVISYREKETDMILEFHRPIRPEKAKSRKAFCQEATQKLYEILESKVRLHPIQWEGWLYLHKYLNTNFNKPAETEGASNSKEILATTQELKFDKKRFGLFVLGDSGFLFDRDNYQTFPIPKQIFKELRYYSEEQIPLSDQNKKNEHWSAFIEKQVFTQSN